MYTETSIHVTSGKFPYIAVRREYCDRLTYAIYTDQEDFTDRKAKNHRFGVKGNWAMWFRSLRSDKNCGAITDSLDRLNSIVDFRKPDASASDRLLKGIIALMKTPDYFNNGAYEEYLASEKAQLIEMVAVAYPEISKCDVDYKGGWLVVRKSYVRALTEAYR